MSDLKVDRIQLGQNGTATQNFTFKQGADGTMTLARGNAGATSQDILTIDVSGNILFPSDTNLLGKSFASTEQTITSAGALVIPHSLGSSPSLFQARLVCKVAEFGYSIGDEVVINNHGDDVGAASNKGISVVLDAVNINIKYANAANTFAVIRKDTGGTNSITNVNWKLVVRAWK